MIERVTEIKRIFALAEREYIVGSITVSLAPSLAVLQKIGRSSSDVGLYLSSTSNSVCNRFWPIHYPVRAVQTFRALRLLEECPKIEEDTLCACYYAMSRDIDGHDDTARHYIDSLKYSGFDNVEECRKRILADRINRACFIENILNPIVNAGATVYDEEIQREINLGILTNDAPRRYILPLKNQVAV